MNLTGLKARLIDLNQELIDLFEDCFPGSTDYGKAYSNGTENHSIQEEYVMKKEVIEKEIEKLKELIKNYWFIFSNMLSFKWING